jgi:hypothetical protein
MHRENLTASWLNWASAAPVSRRPPAAAWVVVVWAAGELEPQAVITTATIAATAGKVSVEADLNMHHVVRLDPSHECNMRVALERGL